MTNQPNVIGGPLDGTYKEPPENDEEVRVMMYRGGRFLVYDYVANSKKWIFSHYEGKVLT